jgi:hypothetical protein
MSAAVLGEQPNEIAAAPAIAMERSSEKNERWTRAE